MPDKEQGRVDFHGLSQCKTLQISGSRGSIVAVRKQGYDNEEVHHGGACALEGKEEGSLKQKFIMPAGILPVEQGLYP